MAQGSNLVSVGHKNQSYVLIMPVLPQGVEVVDTHKQRVGILLRIIKMKKSRTNMSGSRRDLNNQPPDGKAGTQWLCYSRSPQNEEK